MAPAERTLSDATVKATLNGIVKSVGDPDTGTSDGDPFITVTSDSGMYVKGTISELMLSEIQVGSTITGTAGESYTGFTAEITEISEYPADNSDYYYFGGDSNPNVTYYQFLAYIDDAEGLSNNEWADLTIETNQGEDNSSIYLDKRYVRSENGQSYVYKAGAGNKLEKQYVKTGKTLYSTYIEIKQGLSESDSIAFPYGKNVFEGAPVKTGDDSDDGSMETFDNAGMDGEEYSTYSAADDGDFGTLDMGEEEPCGEIVGE